MRRAFFNIFFLGCIHCSFASEQQAIHKFHTFLDEDLDADREDSRQLLEMEIALEKTLAATKLEEFDGLLKEAPSEQRKLLLEQKIEEIQAIAQRVDALCSGSSCFSLECEQKIDERINRAIALAKASRRPSFDQLQPFLEEEDKPDLKKGLQLLELEIVLEKTQVIAKFEEMDALLAEASSKQRDALVMAKVEEIQSLAKRIDALNKEKKEKNGSSPEEEFYCFSTHCEHRIAIKLNPPEIAQAKPVSKPQSSSQSHPESTCTVCDQSYRIDVRHIEGGGVGYNQGYSTLDGYFSLQRGEYIPFIDVRGHVFNDGKWATNAGIGLRYLLNPLTTMIGGNLYYDYRKTSYYHYNQVGAGLEAFFSRWACYINGYLPVGKKRKGIDHTFDGLTFNSFFEHSILMNRNYTDTREFAMRGFDAEIGIHCLNSCNRDLYVGAGPYYFNADGSKTTWGGKIRIKAKITKYFSLEVSDSFDHLFHNRLQGSVALSFPIGKQKSTNRSLSRNLLCKIAQESPQRQEIVVVNKAKKSYSKGTVTAVDPATGQPYFVVFIDNTNTNPMPNGTFENPFPTALGAQNSSVAGNIIYAFPGDGTTNGMNLGITLKDNQRLLGSAVSHGFNTTLGPLVVPAQTFDFPHISNPAGDNIIELNSIHGAEVSGFNISMTNINKIGIHGASLTGLTTITGNIITGEATGLLAENDGIRFEGVQDRVLIDSNTITNTGRNAIFVRSDGGGAPREFTITNNVMVAPFENALFVQTYGSAFLELAITGNQVTNSAAGFLIFNNITPISGVFSRNIFSNNASNGIVITPNTAAVALQFFSNHMDNNASNGVRVRPTGTGSACVQFIDNVATGNTLGDYYLDGSVATVSEEPPSGNIGNFSRTNVTSVSEGFCPF